MSFYVLDTQLLIWVIRPKVDPYFLSVPVSKNTLIDLVHQVRNSLKSSYPAFDVASSFELYRLLFAPVQEHLSGVKHLILIPDEILLPLPFAALVTRDGDESYRHAVDLFELDHRPSPQKMALYADLSWLVKRFAISVLPSATTLPLLRNALLGTREGTLPFLGFGDPDFHGDGPQEGGQIVALDSLEQTRNQISRLNSLPGTREELLAVAKALHVNPDNSVYLGEQASEFMVNKLNRTGVLGKILNFIFCNSWPFSW